MPGTNLTRDEARARAALLEVDAYDVRLDLAGASVTTFPVTTVVRFRAARPGASTFADLVADRVQHVELNGRVLDPETAWDGSRIALDDLAADNELRVDSTMRYSHTGEGLHRFVDPADDRVYLYSQCEVPDARRIFTTFEQPDLKAVFDLTVRAPRHWTVVSNAPTPVPEDDGDAARWRFPTTQRLSTYLTAVVAGEYHQVHDVYDGPHGRIPLGHYCRQSVADQLDVAELVEVTRQGFAFFEDAFEFPYPFAKYDQLYVPEFNSGAMENAGCVVFRDEYLPRSRQARWFYEQRANTILHEMAHMWFGDLVTMRWWDDLWLNESFAEWAATHAAVQATAYDEAWVGFTNNRKNWAYRQDQLPTTHPVAADNHDLEAVEVNFDGITYAKGASALKQLVGYVGEGPFLDGLRAYFRAHAYGNTDFADLLDALEATSGRDLRAWAHAWLQTSGVSTLAPELEVDGAGGYSRFAVRQTVTGQHATLRPHRIGVGLFDRDGDRLVRRRTVWTDVAGDLTEVPELVGVAQPDLLLLNDGDLTYAKVRLDERSLATALRSVGAVEDPLARALCWGAAWDMTRDGELAAGDFVDLVVTGLADESDDTAVKQLPIYTQIAVDQFTHPEGRPAVRRRWEEGVERLLRSAEPGSSKQLTLAKCFAGTIERRRPPSSYSGAGRSPEALDLLERLVEGRETLPGLSLDADLRWTMLIALAGAGRIDRARVEAERAADRTTEGTEKGAAALAALPDPATKESTWVAAMLDPDLPNETQRQIAFMWDVAQQPELTAPYLERYLEAAETIWEQRGVQMGSTALEYLFPRSLTSPETLERLDAWLATTRANPAALRFVREGRDDVVRALRAQQTSRAADPDERGGR